MASLTNIPVELLLKIVVLILDDGFTLPTVGQDAVSVTPPSSQISWNLKPSIKKRINQKLSRLPWKHSSEPVPRSHCSLKALRATNRLFDEICQPFLYRELNLLSDLKLKRWNKAKHILPFPRWALIRFISVYMDRSFSDLDPTGLLALAQLIDQAKTVADILQQCRNLTGVALYYRHATVQTRPILSALLSLLGEGRLTAIGLYSCRLLQSRSFYYPHMDEIRGVVDLLETIALYEPAQRSLHTLDVVAEWIPVRVFDMIRSNFTALRSLTLRRVVHDPWFKGFMWDLDQQSKWYPYPNLTHLHLDEFEPGDSAHFPPLVQHFKALEVLKISACGGACGAPTKWRAPGWSQNPDALCNNHRTLKTLYVAHMDGCEINELGVIPATTVIITTIRTEFLVEIFSRDDEIFPGLQALSLASLEALATVENLADGMSSMEALCNARNVSIQNDASFGYWPCRCFFHNHAEMVVPW